MIDYDRLRRDLLDDAYAGYFAGIGPMLMEAFEIEDASDEELLRIARQLGVNLNRYRI